MLPPTQISRLNIKSISPSLVLLCRTNSRKKDSNRHLMQHWHTHNRTNILPPPSIFCTLNTWSDVFLFNGCSYLFLPRRLQTTPAYIIIRKTDFETLCLYPKSVRATFFHSHPIYWYFNHLCVIFSLLSKKWRMLVIVIA